MKRTHVLVAALFSLLALNSQAQIGKTTFGVRAGINFQNINGKDPEGDKLDNKIKTGFNIGVNAEIPLVKEFYLQPGILFTTKGYRHPDAFMGRDFKVNLSYIEIPVNFLYKPAFGPGHILLGVGPYLAFGVGGNVKLGDEESDVEFDKDIDLGQYATGKYFRRGDAGLNFLAGYEFNNKFSAQLNAQLGLAKINPNIKDVSEETAYRNTGFGISIGYRF